MYRIERTHVCLRQQNYSVRESVQFEIAITIIRLINRVFENSAYTNVYSNGILEKRPRYGEKKNEQTLTHIEVYYVIDYVVFSILIEYNFLQTVTNCSSI